MAKAPEATEVEFVELEDDAEKKGGPIRSLFRLLTLPFRILAGLVRAVIVVIGAVIGLILLPVRLVWALVRTIVKIAADIVYAIWRVIMGIVGFFLDIILLAFRIVRATIGAAIRLVLRVVVGSFKLLVRVFTLGKLFGKASAEAEAAKAKATGAAPDLDLAA